MKTTTQKVKQFLQQSTLILFAFSLGLTAKSFNKTSFYVAYDSANITEYVLVLPSVQKVYTHKAGDITNLHSIGDTFSSFPTYSNGELCFSALKAGDSETDGAFIMANKCYEVKFFYIQKESITSGTVFMLYYKPQDKVYEGLAGNASSFKVVKDGNVTSNAKSLTLDDYSEFSFDVKTGIANIGAIETKLQEVTKLQTPGINKKNMISSNKSYSGVRGR